MNLKLTDWDKHLPAEPDEEYQALVRTLQFTENFGILFIRCSPAEGKQLIMQIKQDISEKNIQVFQTKKNVKNLYKQIEQLNHIDSTDILFITGLEESFYEYEEAKKFAGWNNQDIYHYSWQGVPPVLINLNQQRERFRDNFNICFVFLLPLFAIKYFINRAPDFFDWRSGMFEFHKSWEILQQESHIFLEKTQDQYLELNSTQRNKEIIHIQELLAEANQSSNNKYNLRIKLGKLWSDEKSYKIALNNYEIAIKLQKFRHEAWKYKGDALCDLKRYEEAIASYDRALKINPDDDETWENLGNTLGKLGRYKEAIGSYDKALKLRYYIVHDLIEQDSDLLVKRRFKNYDRREKAKNNQEIVSLSEAFVTHQYRLLLLGEPGVGKTVSLLEFALEQLDKLWHEPRALLPVFVSIRTWNFTKEETIIDWLARTTPLDKNIIETKIKQKEILLLLDGLDELPSQVRGCSDEPNGKRHDYRIKFIQKIAEFENIPLIITCRTKDYEEIVSNHNFNIFKSTGLVILKSLEDNQIKSFLHQAGLKGIWRLLKTDNNLRDMARNPLVLTTLTYAYKDRSEDFKDITRTDNINELLSDIFDVFIEKRYAFEKAEHQLYYSLDEIKQILGKIAFQIASDINLDDNEIQIETISKITSKYGKEVNDFVWLSQKINLLVPINELKQIYRFRHLLLRDYFALPQALQALQNNNRKQKIKGITVLRKLKDLRAVNPIINLLLEDKDANVRYEAADALAQLRNKDAFKTLLKALNDKDGDVCTAAIRSLGRYDNAEVAPRLAKLLNHKDRFVREAAVIELGKLVSVKKDREKLLKIVVEPLIDLMRNDIISNVREAAKNTLSAFSDLEGEHPNIDKAKRALQPSVSAVNEIVEIRSLLDLYHNKSEHPDKRVAAVQKLGEIDKESVLDVVIQSLIQALLCDNDRFVRESAAKALSKFNPNRKIIDALNKANREDLISNVRRASEDALYDIYQKLDLGKFKEKVCRYLQLVNRIPLENSLEQINDEIPTLIYKLDTSSDIYEQFKAAIILGEKLKNNQGLANKIFIKKLTEKLDNTAAEVRAAIVLSLGKIGDKKAIIPLIKQLEHKDRFIRANVAEALGELKAEQAVDKLREIWRYDAIQDVRDAIEIALLKIYKATKNSIAKQALKRANVDCRCYLEACNDASKGNIENAIINLQQAIDLNAKQHQEMAKNDSCFDAIRNNERFQALVYNA